MDKRRQLLRNIIDSPGLHDSDVEALFQVTSLEQLLEQLLTAKKGDVTDVLLISGSLDKLFTHRDSLLKKVFQDDQQKVITLLTEGCKSPGTAVQALLANAVHRGIVRRFIPHQLHAQLEKTIQNLLLLSETAVGVKAEQAAREYVTLLLETEDVGHFLNSILDQTYIRQITREEPKMRHIQLAIDLLKEHPQLRDHMDKLGPLKLLLEYCSSDDLLLQITAFELFESLVTDKNGAQWALEKGNAWELILGMLTSGSCEEDVILSAILRAAAALIKQSKQTEKGVQVLSNEYLGKMLNPESYPESVVIGALTVAVSLTRTYGPNKLLPKKEIMKLANIGLNPASSLQPQYRNTIIEALAELHAVLPMNEEVVPRVLYLLGQSNTLVDSRAQMFRLLIICIDAGETSICRKALESPEMRKLLVSDENGDVTRLGQKKAFISRIFNILQKEEILRMVGGDKDYVDRLNSMADRQALKPIVPQMETLAA